MISEVCGVYIINSTAMPQGATGCPKCPKPMLNPRLGLLASVKASRSHKCGTKEHITWKWKEYQVKNLFKMPHVFCHNLLGCSTYSNWKLQFLPLPCLLAWPIDYRWLLRLLGTKLLHRLLPDSNNSTMLT